MKMFAFIGFLLLVSLFVLAQGALNDICSNAITLDPFSDAVVSGDTTMARRTPGIICNTSEVTAKKGLWYKIPSNTTMDIIVSTCHSETNLDTKISIYKGDSCGILECVVANDNADDSSCGLSSRINFFAKELYTYWIFVYASGGVTGQFSLSMSGGSNFFGLINSKTDELIGPLTSDHSYASEKMSSRLNIRAFFDPKIPTKSVLVTFDNPPRSFCEKEAPFSVFGDFQGNYANATIPLGGHTVTATPFAQPACQGTPSSSFSLTQTFVMSGCSVAYYAVLPSNFSIELLDREEGFTLNSNCELIFRAVPNCGFDKDIRTVTLELRNATTGMLVRNFTDRQAPYYLFGEIRNSYGTFPLSEYIPYASYTIQAIIDGIPHPPLSFTFQNDTRRCYRPAPVIPLH